MARFLLGTVIPKLFPTPVIPKYNQPQIEPTRHTPIYPTPVIPQRNSNIANPNMIITIMSGGRCGPNILIPLLIDDQGPFQKRLKISPPQILE